MRISHVNATVLFSRLCLAGIAISKTDEHLKHKRLKMHLAFCFMTNKLIRDD